MKLLSTICLLAIAAWCSGQAVITSIFDGPLPGGEPKGVELYLLTDVIDLSTIGISSANNGSGPTGTPEFTLSGSASQGQYIYITSDAVAFESFFGFQADFEDGVANINGDDAIELFSNGSVIDVFGDVNVDGTGEPWEYLDGWAARNQGSGPDGSTFVIDNWTFSGVDALDGETTNGTAANPVPFTAYSGGMVAPDHMVEVRSNVFDPALLVVDVGDIVQWDNVQGFHNVNGNFTTYPNNTSDFGNGAPAGPPWSYQYTFTTPGYNEYQCDPHAGLGMLGAVMVREVGDHQVEVGSNFFAPQDITIELGETVVWTNVSGFHNVNGSQSLFPDNPEGFTSGAPGEFWTYAHTFTVPGVYDYQCDPHVNLGMTGTVTVNSAYTPVDIATVEQVDANGNALWQDSLVEVTGVVYGPDYRGTSDGVEFFLIDNPSRAGIVVWTNQMIDYQVQEDVEVTVYGRVNQFNGLIQVVPDLIVEVGFPVGGSTFIMDPVVVTNNTEATEGSFIRINDLTLVDASQWPDDNSNANVQALNPAGDTIVIRIDRDINFNIMAPMGLFDVIGLGSQFDNSEPYTQGYQIMPRSDADIMAESAVSDVSQIGVSAIYPNPAADVITIRGDEMIERIRLHDADGRLVQAQSIFSHEASVRVSHVANGIYYMEIHTTRGIGVEKVLIER